MISGRSGEVGFRAETVVDGWLVGSLLGNVVPLVLFTLMVFWMNDLLVSLRENDS